MTKIVIAIASNDDSGLEAQICDHFGRSPYVTLAEVDLDGNRILHCWAEQNPNVNLHQPGTLPLLIRALGTAVVLSGGMGSRALEMFRSHGLEVATGFRGSVQQALEEYLQGDREAAPCETSLACATAKPDRQAEGRPRADRRS